MAFQGFFCSSSLCAQLEIGEVNFLPPELYFGALYFGYSVYMMLNPRPHDNIGHAAHLGGAAFGLVYAVALEPEIAMNNAVYLLCDVPSFDLHELPSFCEEENWVVYNKEFKN